MKNKNWVINILNIVLLLTYCFSFIFKTDIVDNNKNVEEILLVNPNENITNIQLKDFSKNEIIEFDIKNSYGKIGNFIIPLDTIKLNTFIEYLRKPLKMYKILDDFTEKNLEDSQFFSDSLFQLIINENEPVYFGKLNDLANKIYFKIFHLDTLWQIENYIFSFLTTDESFWCNNDLCINLPLEKDITSIDINGNTVMKTDFTDILIFLKSLQGNSLKRFIFTETEINECEELIKIKISNGNFFYYIYVIKKDDKSYFQVYDNKTELKYLKEISEWTFNRIVMEIFG